MEYTEYSAKTVDDAITEACQALSITSDKLDYEVIKRKIEFKWEQLTNFVIVNLMILV